jgi:hypothetical protein
VVTVCPVARLLMVMLAAGTTAPVGSLTVPTMLPVEIVVCADALAEYKKNAEKSATTNQTGRSALRETLGIMRPSSRRSSK